MRSKFIYSTVVAAVALSMTAFAQTNTAAAPAPGGGATAPAPTGAAPTRVGVIYLQKVIALTNDGKKQFDALQKKYETKQAEIQKQASELQELQKQLQTQGDKMNDDARNALLKNIDQKQRSAQQNYDSARADYQSDENEVAGGILKKLEPIIVKYGQDNGFAVILDVNPQTTPVLWAAQSVDISDAIITAYNAQSPTAAPPPSTTRPTPRPPAPTTTTPKPPAAGSTTPKGPAAGTGSTTPKQPQ